MGIKIAIIIACIIMSGFFSATETAFSTFNRIRVKNLAEKGNKRAERVISLSENYDALITTILIGNNIVNILCAALGTLVFVELLHGNQDLATTLSTVVITLAVLIFGEISPKSIAKRRPESFAMFACTPIYMLYVLFYPLSFVFKKWQNLLAKMFKSDEDKGITEEELVSIIEEAEESGDIDEDESELIKSAIEFNDLEVADIFTPRIDITSLPVDAERETIEKQFEESGYSRIPVYDGDLDNIVGILYHKDYYMTDFDKDSPITEILKPVIFVTKTQKIGDVLKDLQEKQLHLAIVTDEYGSTAGIVTLEDIIEEIVGEIWDEHDERIEEIKEIGEGEYIISGKANLEKVFDMFDIDDEPEVLTVNGWAMTILGRIPQEGDSFTSAGLSVEVLKMNGRRIENLHITDVRAEEVEQAEEEEVKE
ncbi:MAG: HlyC/CorC family transporter [Clostridia bacterium]|nr:HlyC/CorC family transporter [Clostridia bacterium]